MKFDLQDHFYAQLHALVMDHADTFRRAGVAKKDAYSLLVAILLRETAIGSWALGIAEDRFVVLCAQAFEEVVAKLDKEYRTRKPKARQSGV
jgi:hypothetical protein